MTSQPFQTDFFAAAANIQQILDALDRIPGAMFMIKNLESRYVYMSRGLRATLHLQPGQEVVGKTDFDLFPKIIAESFRQNDLLVFREGRTLLNEVHAAAYFVGPTKWFFSSKFPIHDHSGKIHGLITINTPYDEVMGTESDLNVLLPAIDHITKHFDESIKIVDLAAKCQISESHFMRLFKQRMKITAYVFLEQVRMYHAIEAVRHSDAAIATIALDSGFYDHSSFVKRFRKLTGTTPLRYRQAYRQQYIGNPAIVLPDPATSTPRPE